MNQQKHLDAGQTSLHGPLQEQEAQVVSEQLARIEQTAAALGGQYDDTIQKLRGINEKDVVGPSFEAGLADTIDLIILISHIGARYGALSLSLARLLARLANSHSPVEYADNMDAILRVIEKGGGFMARMRYVAKNMPLELGRNPIRLLQDGLGGAGILPGMGALSLLALYPVQMGEAAKKIRARIKLALDAYKKQERLAAKTFAHAKKTLSQDLLPKYWETIRDADFRRVQLLQQLGDQSAKTIAQSATRGRMRQEDLVTESAALQALTDLRANTELLSKTEAEFAARSDAVAGQIAAVTTQERLRRNATIALLAATGMGGVLLRQALDEYTAIMEMMINRLDVRRVEKVNELVAGMVEENKKRAQVHTAALRALYGNAPTTTSQKPVRRN